MRYAHREEMRRTLPAREAAEKEARLQKLLDQIRCDAAQARYNRYSGRRLDGEDEHDGGRGRERER
jgi:hypothetical protein